MTVRDYITKSTRWSSALILGAPAVIATASVLLSDFLPSPFGGYADQRFLLVFFLGVLVLGSMAYLFRGLPRNTGVWFSLSPTLLVASCFVLLALPYWGQLYLWVEPTMYAFFFLAIGFCGAAISKNRSVEYYIGALVVIAACGCFAYGAMTINVYLFALNDRNSDLGSLIPWGFVSIRYWSHVATWFLPILPLAVLIGPMKKHRLWRCSVALGAGIWWWIIFLSSARGSALGLAFGTIMMVGLIGRPAIPWLKVFVRYLLLGAAFWLILSVIIPSLMFEEMQVRTLKADSSGRMPLFAEAWVMSLQNFPFGMGPQSWLTHDVITDSYRESRKFGHPHNMYLMWAAEYGWALIMALAVLVAQAVSNFWVRRREAFAENRPDTTLLLTGFGASIVAALFHASVSAVFVAPGSMLIGLFVLIGFWGLIQPRETLNDGLKATEVAVGSKVSLVIILCTMAVAWLFWTQQVWDYHGSMVEDQRENHSGRSLPRFWFHGDFPRSLLEPSG